MDGASSAKEKNGQSACGAWTMMPREGEAKKFEKNNLLYCTIPFKNPGPFFSLPNNLNRFFSLIEYIGHFRLQYKLFIFFFVGGV